jgi:cAMP-binding proteins - catabolite gene activator and regulatory subunit of cAMP-dependent protein kinases
MKKISNPTKHHQYIITHKLQDYMNADLFSLSELCSFEKDEHLIHAGLVSDYLYFVVEGKLMVYFHTIDAKNICIEYSQQSSLIGEAASLWGMVPNASVKAMTPCICVCISLTKYRLTLQNDVCFLKNICQTLSYRLLNSEMELANSLTTPVDARLAKFILSHSQENIFSFQLTTCATILNVSYRHLLRTLMSFCNLNFLAKSKNCYYILNQEALEDLSKHPTLL